MRYAMSLCCACALSTFPALAAAQEKTRILCDREDPAQRDFCVEDTLEVVFAGKTDPATDSILEYAEFAKGTEIEVLIASEVKSDLIQGWVYGVAHDTRFLEILSATTGGTDGSVCPSQFDATSIDVATCGPDPECSFEGRTPGGGFISAVALLCKKAVFLPTGRRFLARATYSLEEDAGVEGTLVEFSERIAARQSPAVRLNVTIDGRSKLWSMATEGWIKRAGAPPGQEFIRGDSNDDGEVDLADPVWTVSELFHGGPPSACRAAADSNGDGALDVADAAYTIRWLLQGGSAPPAPFPACGTASEPGGLPCLQGGACP